MIGRSIRVACAVLLLAPCAVGVAAPAADATLPALAVTTLDGKTFDLAAERGKWVIVNFWATWCSPCIAEMPAISRYVTTHKNVAAIGLAWDRSPRAGIVAFAKKHPVDYPLALVDPDHPPRGFPAPAALPTTYLIAPDGTVAKHFLGPIDAKALDAAIASAPAARASAAKR
ncbi:MAG TPA: TlpA disulfide reductase family protein [Rhodanobacteraceae bacterium]|nr:TlpA disulfide reductase family protein [Rhodanobacteraceae bacterium]